MDLSLTNPQSVKKEGKVLERYSMMIIGKYFNEIGDYINIEKCNKQYNGMIEQFHFNPIPFRNKKEREIFKNIETYNYYKEEERDKKIEKDKRIKRFIHWERIYPKLIERNEKHIYKNVINTTKIKEGECGDEVRYEIYENGGMIIEGNGNVNSCVIDKIGVLEHIWSSEIIEEVIITDGVSSIGEYSFSYCSNLSRITIPSTVSSLGNSCFSWCYNLSSITIPSSVSYIGTGCFRECSNLSKIIVEEGNPIYSIRNNMLMKKGKELIHLIGCYQLREISIPSCVSFLGNSCFHSCTKLSTITLPSSVSSLGDRCFYGCSNLSEITIPTSVSSLGNYCFYQCSNLSIITIPKGISIGSDCFYRSIYRNLQKIWQ